MKTFLITLAVFCFLAPVMAATYNSDGSLSDTQTKVNSAADGDLVTLPAGSFTWTGTLTISGKGIHLQGSGSGRIVARSTSSVLIGTGSKTFTTQAGLSLTPGQYLRIADNGSIGDRMEGTVTSYTGTALVFDSTSITGSGTKKRWIISTAQTTAITMGHATAHLFELAEDATHNVEISGLYIFTGTGSGNAFRLNASGGKPIFIHDSWAEIAGGTGNILYTSSNQGIIWNCSFNSSPFSMAPVVFHMKDCPTTSWTSASTVGTNDTTGLNNFYFEDCDFHAWLNAGDFDDNSRGVIRHCLLNNAGLGTHGADTSNYGQRHFEAYDNEFIFNGYNDGTTFNLNWWFYIRGGTAVITDNIVPDILSTDYGDKAEINMIVMNLQRNGGPNACWGANVGGNQYPAPRQVGMGRVTGAAGNDAITYVGDSEPIYIWANTGTTGVAVTDHGLGECTNPDYSADYIVAGRDYYNDGTPKPSYAKFTYPHPLRTDGSGGGGSSPASTASAPRSRRSFGGGF